MKKKLPYVSALFLALFGLVTLFLSSSIIFDFFDIRAKEGNYVLFVVWANFVVSILYLFAAYGFVKLKELTTLLLVLSTLILIITYFSLKVYISNGGIYETKTPVALIFRISVTFAFTLIAYFTIQRRNGKVLSKS